MSINIKYLLSGDEVIWDSYVASRAEATIFHRSEWKSVIEDSMGYPGHYLMAFKGEQIVGIYPFFILATGLFGVMGISLPYVNYGGIVADSPEIEKKLIDEAEIIGRKAGCSYIELHQRYPLQYELPSSEHKVTSVIPLHGGADEVFDRVHRNVRNKIRKAEKSGVVVQKGTEYLSDFYDVYAENLRDLGTPVITKRFFEHIADKLGGQIAVFRATRLGKTIGAKVTLLDQRTCYFEWSASLRSSLEYAPVHAMNWEAIKNACVAGCEYIDFGRSTAESTHQNFKKYWGVESHTMKWSYQLLDSDNIPGLQKENPKFALAIAMWKRLPVFLSRLLGPPLARRLP